MADATAGRIRPPLDLRRPPAGPAVDGRRSAIAGHPARRGQFAGLGAAPGQLGRDIVVLPSGAGRRRGRVDPGRHRLLAARGPARPVVPAGRPGWPGLGPSRLGIRRVVRRDLRTRADLAVRGAGRGDLLLRGRRPDRAAHALLAGALAGPGDAGGARAVLHRDGRPAGVAWPRILAGPAWAR